MAINISPRRGEHNERERSAFTADLAAQQMGDLRAHQLSLITCVRSVLPVRPFTTRSKRPSLPGPFGKD